MSVLLLFTLSIILFLIIEIGDEDTEGKGDGEHTAPDDNSP